MIYRWFAGFALLSLSACASVDQNRERIDLSAAPDELTAADIAGRWTVTKVGNARVTDDLDVNLNGDFLSGSDGCNSYFGQAIFDRGTLYSGDIGSTLVACTGTTPSARRRLQLGTMAAGIITGNPSLERKKNGRLLARAGRSTMELERTEESVEGAASGQLSLTDRPFEIASLDGEYFDGPQEGNNRLITFTGSTITVQLMCASFSSAYTIDAMRIVTSAPTITAKAGCSESDIADDMKLRAMLGSSIKIAGGHKSSGMLMVANGHWLDTNRARQR